MKKEGGAMGIRIIPGVMIQHFDRAEGEGRKRGKGRGKEGGGGEGRVKE